MLPPVAAASLFADPASGPCLTAATERTVLAAALRTDALAWAEAQVGAEQATTHLNVLLQAALDTQALPAEPAAALALNAWLHRVFQQWGWWPDRGSAHWHLLGFLYLHTYRLPVPRPWRHALATQWAALPAEAAEAAAVELRRVLSGERG